MAKNPNSPAVYGKAMKSAYEATYGKVPTAPKKAKIKMTMNMPLQNTTMSGSTPMMPRRSRVRSVASKLFGGKY